MPAKLKICGITNIDDALACANAGVDWLGFNFFKDSPRYLSPEDAGKIIRQLDGRIKSVAILVRPHRDKVSEIIKESGVDIVQIYEPRDFSDLSQFGVPAIICHRINPTDDKQKYSTMNADMILFDSYSKNVLGGSGEKFNWELIPESIPKDRLILAGGITPENISEALTAVHPAVIDVASGAEISPGKKDIKKVKLMVMKIREYNEKRD